MAAHTLNPLVQKHARNSILLFIISLVGAVSLFYLVLVRPFSAGFDLVSVGQGDGVKASAPLNSNGEDSQNHLRVLSALILSGEYEGSLVTLESIEQRHDEIRPFIRSLEISGQNDEALILASGRPGDTPQTYVFEGGVNVDAQQNTLSTDTLIVNELNHTLETQGPTHFAGPDADFSADNGLSVTQEGDLEIR